jgi:hypothetical protein
MSADMDIVFAVFNFPGTTEEDLPLTAGERIQVISRDDDFGDGWWEGRSLETGRVGLFPKIYTAEHMPSPSLVATSAASLQNESTSDLPVPIAEEEVDPTVEPSLAQEKQFSSLHDFSEAQYPVSGEDDSFDYPALYVPSTAASDSPTTSSSVRHPQPGQALAQSTELWTPTQVAQHFKDLGFDLANKFEEHEVNGRVLLAMQHADLREIDIIAFGKRFEVMREIDALRLQQSQQADARDSSVPNSQSALGNHVQNGDSSTSAMADNVQHLRINTSAAKDHDAPLSPVVRSAPALQIVSASDLPATSSAPIPSPGPSPTKSHKKALSTSSLAFGHVNPGKRHSRAWSQDTAKTSPVAETHARRSDNLGPVPELNGSIASTDSSSGPKSPTMHSPSSNDQPMPLSPRKAATGQLQQKRSLLGRRQPKWRPNAVSENLEQVPVAEAVKNADFSGWLRKRSERNYQWNMRFFVLRGTRLAYYLTDEDTQERGLIDINAYKVQIVDDILFYGPAKLTFKVIPPAPGASRSLNFTPPRTIYFNAETATLMKEWMTAMTKATIGRDWSSPVISSCTTKTISLKAAREQRQAKSAAELNLTSPVEEDSTDQTEDESRQRSELQRQASGASLSSLRKAVMGAAS